jgi:hypothetical protein
LFISLLIGVLVAGAVFFVAAKFLSLIEAGSAEIVATPTPHSLVQTGSEGQRAAFSPFEGRGIEIAAGVSALAFLSCLVWHYYPLYKTALAVLNGDTAALEEQFGGPASVESAFGGGNSNNRAIGSAISSGGQPYTETTTSEGGSGIIGYGERGYALRFRDDRWRQPAERHLPEFGNRWVGERHSGVELRRAAPSFPTAVSRPTVVSRSRR